MEVLIPGLGGEQGNSSPLTAAGTPVRFLMLFVLILLCSSNREVSANEPSHAPPTLTPQPSSHYPDEPPPLCL